MILRGRYVLETEKGQLGVLDTLHAFLRILHLREPVSGGTRCWIDSTCT